MKTSSAVHPLRMRKFEGDDKDPYAARGKLKSPTVCPGCKAVYERGRWRWRDAAPAGAHRETCPACRRTAQRYPAGTVTLKGPFVKARRVELLEIVRRRERKENAAHPLNRIMAVAAGRDGLTVTTTDVHLAHAIGEALKRAHGGELSVRYDAHGSSVRVDWTAKA